MQPSSNGFLLLIPVFVAVLFFFIGAGFLVYALVNRRKAAASAAWAQAGGRVLSATIREQVQRGENGMHRTYIPVIEYEYSVVGAPYRGSRLAFGSSSGGRKDAEETLARYAPGAAVTVYYDPQNPTDAVLERQAHGGTLHIVIGVIFMVGSILCGCLTGLLPMILINRQ